jgi:hypothetical protein
MIAGELLAAREIVKIILVSFGVIKGFAPLTRHEWDEHFKPLLGQLGADEKKLLGTGGKTVIDDHHAQSGAPLFDRIVLRCAVSLQLLAGSLLRDVLIPDPHHLAIGLLNYSDV